MLSKSHSLHYASPPPTDDVGAFLLTLLVIALIVAAILWLIFYQPKKKDEKPLKDEINKIFKELHENALQFKRDEVVPTIAAAKDQVTDLLRKRKLIE